jgi:hypothetical protein
LVSKAERIAEFLKRLEDADPVSSAEDAFKLLSETLNAVEDELSGVPNDPSKWQSDGRMYPPQTDSERDVSERPGWKRFRSRSHNTLIGPDGSIEILELNGKCILEKKGNPAFVRQP